MSRLARLVALPVSIAALGGGIVGCSAERTAGGETASKPVVVAAFYPLAFAAGRIGGDRVTVRDLTPKGAEPHDLEPTTDQVDAIEDAALVVVMGRGFQPSVERSADQRAKGTVAVLDAVLSNAGDVAAEDDDAGGIDPHVWLDPVLMGEVVDAVRSGLVAADPAGEAAYTANAAELRRDLDVLHDDFTAGLRTCARRELVTTHEAFGRLAARYGLLQEGITGLSPDAEPDPKRLAELADLVQSKGVTTVFTEDLVSPELAQTLSRETGAKTVMLSPLEVLADERADADYLSVMRDNLAKLRSALGCE